MNTRDAAKRGLGWGCCSAAAFGLVMVMVWAFVSVTWPHGHKSSQTMCMNNLKQIGVAIEMYAMEWGDCRPPLYTTSQRAPKGQAWPDLLMPYLRKIEGGSGGGNLWKLFRCADSEKDRVSYSANRRIAGLDLRKIKYPSDTISVFDSVSDSPENNNLNSDSIWRPSDGGVPKVGSLPLWPEKQPLFGPKLPKWARPRHRARTNILFADGHISSMSMDSSHSSPEYAPRFDPAKPRDE